MDVFSLRDHLIQDYYSYISSFIQIRDPHLQRFVNHSLSEGLLWPDPLIQLNPAFETGHSIDELVDEGLLDKACKSIFRRKSEQNPGGNSLLLHKHQEDAIRTARQGHNYVLTTGTGSGKSLAYIIPIVDHVLRNPGKGIKAIIVYPMNALANSQMGELGKFLKLGFPDARPLVTFERYTGQESDDEKNRIMANPPDILLTNYVMLELILTRPKEQKSLVVHAQSLRFLVLDELHTYRGRQGADVAMLVRRVRNVLNAHHLQCVGTSATLASKGSVEQQRQEVARVATLLFGDTVKPEHVIGETLRRVTPEHAATDPLFTNRLAQRVSAPQAVPADFESLRQDPLASWIESHLGLNTDSASGRLVRAHPRSISGPKGAARQLSEQVGLPENRCAEALTRLLMAGYNILNPADLTRRELEDILDPWEEVSDLLDPGGYAARAALSDFPGETFRVLKEKEIKQFGEYRTRRLVLEARERLEGLEIGNPQGYQASQPEDAPAQEVISLRQPPLESPPPAAPPRPEANKPRLSRKPAAPSESQPMLPLPETDFGLYQCAVCGKMVMGFDRENHAREVHMGKSVKWREMR